MIEVDARGLSCPEPVIQTMNAMKANPGEALRVLVSTTVARDNVCALAKRQKRSATVEAQGEDFAVSIQ